MKTLQQNMFLELKVQEAIVNIKKFAHIAQLEDLNLELGFSGGKDSIVIYHLTKLANIKFTPIFNYAFEDMDIVNFIKQNYPDIQIHKKPTHYLKLIQQTKLLPSQQIRYCCTYYKEQSQNAIITGVRRYESRGRQNRKLFGIKYKKNTKKYNDIFISECTEQSQNKLMLRPIINWKDTDVWQYIYQNKLPYPNIYNQGQKRCGCMLCPLATLDHNIFYFKKKPALINFAKKIAEFSDLTIKKTNKKYTAEQYIFVWLNHFKEPSEKQKQTINNIYNRIIF
ncbi:MAG: phosphoadenosine phosphosulfate reductase family protein [Prevotellaceae bacterium]|nr:phosphoadenosine phosphosulfate reductase family protein [Prevotellaceae bacterium]